ncbi:MAG TPA: hypothetical protein VFL29_09325 [Candidatus Dormibacteraeota bacterium]|nr:hypothetical protein [Candidatus Dormibacteraeota bacterium]
MAAWDREVNITSIDGVPVVWAEAAGPLRATLMFRVGRVDEKLAWGGITHLVEHLALFHLGPRQTYEFNGAVTSNRTLFYASGSPQEIVTFLGHVTTSLANLPLDRAETEKSVLLAEASSRPLSPADVMFSLRFGARGNGLHRYKEFGLYHLTPDWIKWWATRCFTRDNAVLWMSGPPPSDLRLQLPPGQRLADVPVTPLPLSLPAYAQANVGGAGVSMVAARSTALAMASSVAATRLLQRLRYEKGIAYSVQGGYFPMDQQQAHVSLWTDAQQGQAATVLENSVHSIYGMSTEGPSPGELAEEVETFTRNLDRDEAPLHWLDRTAVRLLNGEPVQRPSELVEDMRSVTPSAARDAMASALRTAIYLGPSDVPAPAGIHAYVIPSVDRVRGQVLQHVGGQRLKHPPELTFGDDGVTMDINPDDRVTVRYQACEAVIKYGDGGICLVGSDGSFMPINPGEWVQAPAAIQRVLQLVPPEVVAPIPNEKTVLAVNVPAPQPKSSGFAPMGVTVERWIGLFVFVAVAVALLAFAFFGNASRIGSGPPLISLVIWFLIGLRFVRRLL